MDAATSALKKKKERKEVREQEPATPLKEAALEKKEANAEKKRAKTAVSNRENTVFERKKKKGFQKSK
jgi:hypothetical protein